MTLLVGCGSPSAAPDKDGATDQPTTGSGGAGSGGSTGSGGTAPDVGGSGGRVVGSGGPMPIPGTCQAPDDVEKPYEKLSETGCMDAATPTKMAARLFLYDVNVPLWSDNANKSRGLALPPGGKIHVKSCANVNMSTLKMGDECCVVDPNNYPNCLPPGDDGKWVFPVGTVMVKNFMFDSKMVETRLFVRLAEKQWVGYSYQWNEAQTEATIVGPERLNVMFKTGMRTVNWNYPSRKDCMLCHNEPAGSILGPETVQMNRVMLGDASNMNQIDKLAALNAFDVAPAKPYKVALVTPYAIPGQVAAPPASATTQDKVLSYMHANCSYCHRPDGTFYNMDLRHDTALTKRGVCYVMPMKGDLGVTGARVMVPGTSASSLMWLRMNSAAALTRMPQVGTAVVDVPGTALMAQWINSIRPADCPEMP
jgi:hypothetical protein